MSRPLITDELWAVIEPLLPPKPPKPKGEQPHISNRAVLKGIVFVLKSDIPWEMLPQEPGCGSGMICWRRLRDWQYAGVWERLHQTLLQRLSDARYTASQALQEVALALVMAPDQCFLLIPNQGIYQIRTVSAAGIRFWIRSQLMERK